MSSCQQTNIPELNLETDPCEGVKKLTECIIHSGSITSLGLPPNSTQKEINDALVLTVKALLVRIQQLEQINQ